jgi:hypothetical protein
MTNFHRIRLREPWEVSTLDDSRSRRSRRFGRPRQLEPHERIWLVIQTMPDSCTVHVNGRELQSGAVGFRFEVTDLLEENNRIQIELPAANEVGEVFLEIG